MDHTRRRSLGSLIAASLVAVFGPAVVGPPAAQAAGDLTTWTLSTAPSGGPLTLDLTKVSLRGPDFRVLDQQADGTFLDVTGQLPAEQDYLGTVEGHPEAAVALTRLSDGTVEGEVVLDRGITWWFTGNAVTGTRGSATVTYKWPLRRPMTTDVIGSSSYRDEVGYDIDSALFTGLGGDPVRALDMVQYSLNMQRLPWMQDTGLTPMAGTVILRGSATQDPYASLAGSGSAYLGAVRSQWLSSSPWLATPGSYPDTQVQVISNRFGGGLAYLNNGTRSWNFGAIGGSTTGWGVLTRHEGSHNFGINDEHGGDPEGATIQSGNAYARYDSTELYALAAARNAAAGAGSIKPLGTYTATQLPPYAATAYVEATAHGPSVTFDPINADHSANGSPLHLVSVQGTSSLGATVTASGDQVTYQPPASPSSAVDTFTYVVGDANGHTATGVVMVKNTVPFQRLEAEVGTVSPVSAGSVVTDGSDHSGSGFVKLTAAGGSVSWTVSQPAERDVTVTVMTKSSAGNATLAVDGGTPVALGVPAATPGPENEGTIWTPVTTTVHLTAGSHTLTYAAADVAQSVDDLRLDWADAAPVFPAPVSASSKAGRAFSVPLTSTVTDADLPSDAVSFSLLSPYTWWGVSGSTLSGTAPATGTYTGTLVATDASGLASSTTVTLTVTKDHLSQTQTTVRRSAAGLVVRVRGQGRGLAGSAVSIQRRSHHRWSAIAVVSTGRRGVARFRTGRPGVYRAVFAGDGSWLPSVSRGRRIGAH